MKTQTRAFTLIELMVVVMILSLLMTILIPTIGPMLQSIQKAKTRARIISLQGAADSYQAQHGMYPGQEDLDIWGASEEVAGDPKYTGTQVLAAHLFDYYDDTPGATDPYANCNLDNPEPKTSYGHYEPGMLDDFPPVSGTGDDIKNCISDTFSTPHPIVYYPSGSGQGPAQFAYALNQQLTGKGRASKFTSFITDDSLRTPSGASETPFKNGMFLLISPGPDSAFFTEDDIKNWN